MVGIPLDEGGMCPDAVERELDRPTKKTATQVLHISTYQNPTAL